MVDCWLPAFKAVGSWGLAGRSTTILLGDDLNVTTAGSPGGPETRYGGRMDSKPLVPARCGASDGRDRFARADFFYSH
jgi:hypothetical protein